MQNRNFRVIDCFTFFNELDLLRLRIKVLDKHVDHFAIAEARQTFTGLPKQCLLNQENAPDIINHPKVSIKTVDLPGSITNWEREDFQRESTADLVRQLSTRDEDIILLSDVDEIPSPQAINSAISELQTNKNLLCVFEQRVFYFRINYELIYSRKLPWLGTTAIQAMNLTTMASMRATGRKLRGKKHRHHINKNLRRKQIAGGGWHFSYAGQDDSLKIKLQSFCHQEQQIQASKTASISHLISERRSLFPHKSTQEVWAVIPLEDLGMPASLMEELRQFPFTETGPYTPASEIVRDVLLKSRRKIFKLGKFRI